MILNRISESVQSWVEAVRARQITLKSARHRAAQGAAYLDEVDRGWYRLIDTTTLDLGNARACVLAQLYGCFAKGLCRTQLINALSAPRTFVSPVRLGFLAVQGVCDALQEQDYDYLNQAWQDEIRSRRERSRMRVLPPFIELTVSEPMYLN